MIIQQNFSINFFNNFLGISYFFFSKYKIILGNFLFLKKFSFRFFFWGCVYDSLGIANFSGFLGLEKVFFFLGFYNSNIDLSLYFFDPYYSKNLIFWEWGLNLFLVNDEDHFFRFSSDSFSFFDLFLISKFIKLCCLAIVGVSIGWILVLNILGYNYLLDCFLFKNSNKLVFFDNSFLQSNYCSYLKVSLGFRFQIFLILPKNVRIFCFLRKVYLTSSNFYLLNFISNYLRYLRDLLPYKEKGLIFDEEVVVLKKSNKVRLRSV